MSDRPRILLFTGEGKGKTTAALGMALRACGHGMRVCVIQFVKKARGVGECRAAGGLAGLEIVQVGRGFLPPPGDPRIEAHRRAAQRGLRRARRAIESGEYALVVLDEVCFAVQRELVTAGEVAEAVRLAPPATCVVMTGRGAPDELVDLADTVTEMRCVKHGMDNGTPAQRGVEF